MSNKRTLDQLDDSLLSNKHIKKDIFALDVIDSKDIPNDTEAAILYIKKILLKKFAFTFAPVILLHQIYSIIKDKAVVEKQIRILQNINKIIVFQIEDSTTVIMFYDDLKDYVLNQTELNTLLYQKYFDKVLKENVNIGVSKLDLTRKYRYTEQDIRNLVTTGLLILKHTNYYLFSFPSVGTFIKYLQKDRKKIMTFIKKRKYSEILESELEKKYNNNGQLYFELQYDLYDLIGGGYISSTNCTSGKLLRVCKY